MNCEMNQDFSYRLYDIFSDTRTENSIIQNQQWGLSRIAFSLILFLFYNNELLKLCCQLKEKLSAIEFADDVNMLLYKRITETNCKNLEQTHERCMKWARQHEMRFASQKYKLVHFIKACMKFNMQISIHFFIFIYLFIYLFIYSSFYACSYKSYGS